MRRIQEQKNQEKQQREPPYLFLEKFAKKVKITITLFRLMLRFFSKVVSGSVV